MRTTDGDHRPTTVLSVQKFNSGPPIPSTSSNDGQLVGVDGDVLATSKQEEWITKKKTELVTTKQIETRVKRQVVLEDGKVVEDSGPLVTTTTTEDTDKNESEQTEHKEHGGDGEPGEGWVAIESVPEDAVVKEMNERKVTTHDEVEDVLETEEVRHLGDVSSEKLVRAIREGSGDTRSAFLKSDRNDMVALSPYDRDAAAQRRVVQQSRRHDRKTDIEDTKEVSKFNERGNLVTEITKRHEHEDFHNEDIPDSDSDEFEHIEDHEGTQDYSHSKNENYVEYLSIPRGGSRSQGVKIGEGARVVSENIQSERAGDEDLWDSVSERIRKTQDRIEESTKLGGGARSDALTSRPLDFSQEEQSRKHETNRWLSSHFGSSSSSLNSEPPLRRSPLQSPPTGIHVTMTSTRNSPVLVSPTPPPPPPLPGRGGKRITFQDSPSPPPRPSPIQKDVKFDLKNRHENVMRSMNSQFGRATVTTKSGEELWDESSPTPTPPPRSRRRNSPDMANRRHTSSPNPGGMYSRKFDQEPPYHHQLQQKMSDTGERKSFERREEGFGYSGSSQPLSRDSFKAANFGDGYVTKHNNYYKTSETDNPGQNALYDNGEAEITERKTVERREQNFTYAGPSQKQFHPKYILGVPNSTVGRLKGIEATGPGIDEDSTQPTSYNSQSLPRRRFYFGDEEGSLPKQIQQHPPLEPKRSGGGGYGKPKELRHGGGPTDDINVSISNNYNLMEDMRKSSSLNRSMSFTPSSLRERPGKFFNRTESTRQDNVYKSNPQLLESADLLSPRLITNISRGTRDVSNGYTNSTWTQNMNERNVDSSAVYSNRYEAGRSKKSVLDSVKKSSSELYEPKTSLSPSRSVTPTRSFSPMGRIVGTRSPGYGKSSGGTGLSDDYQETHRMTSSTPDTDVSQPRITTDTTSKFSRRTLRNDDGAPAGKVESSETTTRTKSRFKESEVMYPNGGRVDSGMPLRSELKPKTTSGGGVVIPVRDPNNNKHVHYAK